MNDVLVRAVRISNHKWLARCWCGPDLLRDLGLGLAEHRLQVLEGFRLKSHREILQGDVNHPAIRAEANLAYTAVRQANVLAGCVFSIVCFAQHGVSKINLGTGWLGLAGAGSFEWGLLHLLGQDQLPQ